MSSLLREIYHLNILSWQTEHYLDGSFRSTKTLKMNFKELPTWFTMSHVDKDNKVEPTNQILDYIKLDSGVFSVKEELIAIVFAEKSKTKEMMQMMDIATVCCSDCGEDFCDCKQSTDEEQEEEEVEDHK